MSGNPYTPQFAPFQSGCSMCKPSSDYYQVNSLDYSQVGSGNYSNDGLVPASNGKNLYSAKNYEMNLDQKFMKNNLGIDYATSFGGAKPKSKKPKSKKPLKGGEYGTFNLNEMHDESVLSGGKKPKKSNKGKKPLKGGNPQSDPLSDPLSDLNKLLSMTQKSDEIMSGGDYGSVNFNQTHDESLLSGGKKPKKFIKGKKSLKGGEQQSNPLGDLNKLLSMTQKSDEIMSGGKKNPEKSKGKKPVRKMKGGMESSGATPMDQRFFNVDSRMPSYSELSGNGIESAYGPIVSGNVGTGMLAPYNSSTSSSANHNTMLKTGGAKGKKPVSKKPKAKKMKGGDGPIPEISDSPITFVKDKIDGAIGGFSSFMEKLNKDYLQSVQSIKNTKIGGQRLVGGKKAPKKKPVAKKPKAKKMRGGDGSDWATSQGSRGPANAPDAYWGVPGEQWFRQFNKTGDYIPNSKLAVAATPQLAGHSSNAVSGYDEMDFSYGTA
jgi:hypothetical protein